MTEYRASFDAAIRFSNGGDLTAHGFRVDVPSPEVDEAAIAALFVASLGLLMTDSVQLSNVEIVAEPHKGTRGGPSDHVGGRTAAGGRLVELSHVIRAGMITYPGLPGPEITPYLTREASRQHYAPGTEFAIDRLTLVGNTGTYLDAPYHRYPGGADLSGVPLGRIADLPAVVVRVTDAPQPGVDVGALAAVDVRGMADRLHRPSGRPPSAGSRLARFTWLPARHRHMAPRLGTVTGWSCGTAGSPPRCGPRHLVAARAAPCRSVRPAGGTPRPAGRGRHARRGHGSPGNGTAGPDR